MKALILTLAGIASLYVLHAAEPAGRENPSAKALRARIVETAKKYIGTMYRYGGRGEAGFDCSGFVQFVYKQNGIILPRTAAGQFNQGTRIDLASASPGDLVFFKIDGRRISHVGIFLNGLEFIHSPSTGKRVAVARIDADYWRKRFAGAVTYIVNTASKGGGLNGGSTDNLSGANFVQTRSACVWTGGCRTGIPRRGWADGPRGSCRQACSSSI